MFEFVCELILKQTHVRGYLHKLFSYRRAEAGPSPRMASENGTMMKISHAYKHFRLTMSNRGRSRGRSKGSTWPFNKLTVMRHAEYVER